MNILITGANGFLGQYLVAALLQKGHRVTATGRGPCRLDQMPPGPFRYVQADISTPEGLQRTMAEEHPEVVIHCAAMTQADECEQNQQKCFEINVQATAQLLLDAESCGSFFILLSTDFVFDGERGDYEEKDLPNPISWYGFTKVQAESLVETSELPWAIIRTCLVYGQARQGTRANLLSWVKDSLEKGQSIRVVSDQWRTPTEVEDLVKGILLVIEKRATGIFHLSGSDRWTPYEMALATARHCGLDAGLIERVDASSFTQPARRPPRTGFNISKAISELGFKPLSFSEGLKKMFPPL